MFCILTAGWFTSGFIMCLNNDYARQCSIYNAATSCIIHKEPDKFLYQIRVFWLRDCSSSSLPLGVFYRCSWGVKDDVDLLLGEINLNGPIRAKRLRLVERHKLEHVSLWKDHQIVWASRQKVTCRRVLRPFSRVNIHVKKAVWLVCMTVLEASALECLTTTFTHVNKASH